MSITAEQLSEAVRQGQDVIIVINGEYYELKEVEA